MIQGALTRLFTAAMNWLCWVCIWAICMPAAAMASLASLPLDSVSLSAPPSARSSWIATSARPTTSLLREANSGDTCPCHYHATGHPALLHRKAIQTTGKGVVLVLNLSGWQMVLTTAAISSGPNSTSWSRTLVTSQSWSSCTVRQTINCKFEASAVGFGCQLMPVMPVR